jgi:regulator of replication initiation timing
MGLFGWLADRWTPIYEFREYYGDEMEEIARDSTAVGSKRGFLLGFPAGVLLTVAVVGGAVMTGLYTPPAQTVASREGQREAAASQATTKELAALQAENQGLKKQVTDLTAAAQAPTKELVALRAENQGLKTQVMDVNAASQATTKELAALRKENQGLKTQVTQVRAAGSQATTKELAALRAENQGLKKQVVEVKAAAICPPCQPQTLTNARSPSPAVAAPPQLWPPPEPRGSPRPGAAGPSDR